MEEKIYTITLADGTIISDLKLNGNNYVSETELSDDLFKPKNLKTITVFDGENTVTQTNMRLVQKTMYGDGNTYFILAEMGVKDNKSLENSIKDVETALIELYGLMRG